MKKTKGLDSWLERLKRLERRYYLADYQDERLRLKWLEKPPAAPFEERVFPVLPEPASIQSLLIFKPDDIGDAVQALPALVELRKQLPKTRLFLLCQQKTAPLFERTGLLDEIVAMEVKMRGRRFPSLPLEKSLAQFSVPQFDAAIFLRTYPVFFSYFLKIPAKAKIHPADPRLVSDSVYRMPVTQWGETRLHQSLQLLEIVALLTRRVYTFADAVYPKMQWNDEDRKSLSLAFVGEKPKHFFVIHPFVKDETRRYPEEYWVPVLRYLRSKFSATPVIVGGPEDPKISGLEGMVQTQGQLNLMQTAHLISESNAFIGNESGPAHLAAALGKPTITLMGGHSLPAEWAPLGKSLILRADVPCAPCHLRTCPVYGLACLKELRPERVLPEIESFLLRHAFPTDSGI